MACGLYTIANLPYVRFSVWDGDASSNPATHYTVTVGRNSLVDENTYNIELWHFRLKKNT